MLAFASEAIYEPFTNKDLSIPGQSNYLKVSQVRDLYVCMLLCSNKIECASIRFQNNVCKLFHSVKLDYFIDSVGTFIYRRKKVLGLNLGYDLM